MASERCPAAAFPGLLVVLSSLSLLLFPKYTVLYPSDGVLEAGVSLGVQFADLGWTDGTLSAA